LPLTIVAAAVAAFAIGAYRVLTSELDALLTMVPDDAFYYLQIARHLATTGESTFDGLSSTNGYHPVWMAMLSALAALVDDRTMLLRIAIGLSFGLHVGVALLLFRAIRRIVDDAWGWTAALCWLINPLAFAIAITTTEAAVYAWAAAAVFLTHLALTREREAGRLPSVRLALRYGATLGLLSLARTDGLVIAAMALTWLASFVWPRRYAVAHVALRLLAAGGALAVVLLPWWLFSLAQVGTVVQDSGAMKMLWASDAFPTAFSRLQNVGNTLEFFARRTLTLMTVWNYSWGTFAIAAVTLAVAPAMVLIRQSGSIEARALRAVIAAVLALTIVYGSAFIERQIWWLTLPCLATILVMFVAAPTWLQSRRAGPAVESATRVALVVIALLLFVRWHVKGHTPYPWQPDVRRSQLAMELLVPASERIGCFNAGIPAYFGSGRVVALDGLVNHDARLSWTKRRLEDYVARNNIAYIADEEPIMAKAQRFSSAPIPLAAIASYPLRGWPTGKRVLWQVGRTGRELP
jgi:hypothetical protein